MKLNSNIAKVKATLEKWPDTRDNDTLLLLYIWEQEYSTIFKKPLIEQSMEELVDCLQYNRLSHFESIRRNRQRLQAKYPELRGKSYNIRKGIAVEETEQELGYIRTPIGAPGTKP